VRVFTDGEIGENGYPTVLLTTLLRSDAIAHLTRMMCEAAQSPDKATARADAGDYVIEALRVISRNKGYEMEMQRFIEAYERIIRE
jgi:hypothetical protein